MFRIVVSGSFDSSIFSFLGNSLLKFTFYKGLFYGIAYFRTSKQDMKSFNVVSGFFLY